MHSVRVGERLGRSAIVGVFRKDAPAYGEGEEETRGKKEEIYKILSKVGGNRRRI